MKKCLLWLAVVLICTCSTVPKAWDAHIISDVKVFPQVSGALNSAVFSPCERYVLTGDNNGAVKIWEAETGILVRSFYGHEGAVLSVAWSPDGKFITSGSWDNTIKIWNADFSSDARELYTLKHERSVYSVTFCPNSHFLVSGSYDHTVRIWDVSNGKEIKILRGHENTVTSASVCPNGKYIASASADRTIIIWDFDTGDRLRTLSGHSDPVYSVAWSPIEKKIVSASWDMTARIWDTETGDTIKVIGKEIFKDVVYNAKFSPDGAKIVSTGGSLTLGIPSITIWDVETGSLLSRFDNHSQTVVSVEWDKEGNRIVTASYDNTAMVYNTQTGECLTTFTDNTDALWQAVLSKDENWIVTGSDGKKINIWNAKTGILERSLEFTAQVRTVAIHSHSNIIAVGGVHRDIQILDIESGNEKWTLKGHRGMLFDLAFHPDGKFLASASGDETIRIWNLETGFEIDTLFGHNDVVETLKFNTDGSLLISGSRDRTVRVWKSAGEGLYILQHTLSGHNDVVLSIDISSDSRRIVSGSRDGTIRYWDAQTGWRITALGTDIFLNGIKSVIFSNDKYILASSYNQKILKWEIAADDSIKLIAGKEDLLGVPFSLSPTPDGKRLLAGLSDGTARLYNIDDLSEIACFAYFSGEDKQAAAKGAVLSSEATQAISQIDGDWLTITHDGFYRGSPRADRFINVLINNYDLHAMDSFSDFFHRPDVV
ncbi:MAG: WD40 repeat domain-containing protein, partial [Treponema sp.]|nr:WD40 repeat domain-containing protein [Treponema sp.]